MSILETVQRMIVEQFDLKQEALVPEATLESLGLDSLSVIEFMFNIEDEFKIKLSDIPLENLKTLQDVIDVIDKQVAEQHAKAE
jgi:acyl carrier protein